MEIVLIDLLVFQKYILDNIRNLKLFGNNNITVITDNDLKHHFINQGVNIICTEVLDSYGFDNKTSYKDTFWTSTSKRLFYLYSYMKKFNKKNVIHVENDYLIYFSTDELKNNKDLEKFVWLTMDSDDRCIPGIIFVPNYTLLDPLIKNYDFTTNDMFNMGMFYNNNKSTVRCFPVMPEKEYFNSFNMIFDAAAIGQYLGGIDPIHKDGGVPGFINERFYINFSDYSFFWYFKNTWIPMLIIEDKFYKIGGIHVHSKNLGNFQTDFPREHRLIQLNINAMITFGNSGNFLDAVSRITHQAKTTGIFNYIKGFKSLDSEFTDQHSEFIENNPRGYGYWLWKPYIILKTLELLPENSVLLYADSGCEIDFNKKDKIKEILKETDKHEIICSFAALEIENTKRDLFIHLDLDNWVIHKTLQNQASAITFKKCERVMNFVKEWYTISCKYNLIDDSPSENQEYPEFIENRHDQSIFSLLMKKYYHGIKLSTNYQQEQIVLNKAIDIVRNRTGNPTVFSFDWKLYLSKYPDLQKAGIDTESKALIHYNRFGKKENRICF